MKKILFIALMCIAIVGCSSNQTEFKSNEVLCETKTSSTSLQYLISRQGHDVKKIEIIDTYDYVENGQTKEEVQQHHDAANALKARGVTTSIEFSGNTVTTKKVIDTEVASPSTLVNEGLELDRKNRVPFDQTVKNFENGGFVCQDH